MRISGLGEFRLIERIKRKTAQPPVSIKAGIGDDCAVLPLNANYYSLFTTDTLVEGVDFLKEDDHVLIGRKAIGSCLSDIAACAGIPLYALVSLGLPRNFNVKKIDSIYLGINRICKDFGLSIVGGDISRCDTLFINVSMLGEVEKKNLTLRNKARGGDVIFVSGSLGGASRSKHFRFTPRIREARFLVEHFKIHSMIDISDGFIQDLGHIVRQSKVGAVVFAECIPTAQSSVSPEQALGSGEEFELIFTLAKNEAARLLTSQKGRVFSPVGYITGRKRGLQVLDSRNKPMIIKSTGFSHF